MFEAQILVQAIFITVLRCCLAFGQLLFLVCALILLLITLLIYFLYTFPFILLVIHFLKQEDRLILLLIYQKFHLPVD